MPGSRCTCFAFCPFASMALWADLYRDFPPPWAGTPGMHWTLPTQVISQAFMIMSTKLKIITWFLEDKFVADRMVGADSEEKACRHAVCSLSLLWHWRFPLSCIQTCICLPMRSPKTKAQAQASPKTEAGAQQGSATNEPHAVCN